MRTFITHQKVIDRKALKALKSTTPSRAHVNLIINEDAVIINNGKLVALYTKAPFDHDNILSLCLGLKFDLYQRSSGLRTQTINLGSSPRNPLRDNYCRPSKFKRDDQQKHKAFENIARLVATVYRHHFSEAYIGQIKQSYVGKHKIAPQYLIKGTPFTGGVINKDSALGYHYDKANTKEGISCMVILKAGVAGGELILPQLDLGFSCQDGYLLLFDGRTLLHGVTPIIKAQQGKGYRFTIVYYNNEGMELCGSLKEEVATYQKYLDERTEANES